MSDEFPGVAPRLREMTTTALAGVRESEAGLGSGVQATMTHAGGALGLAILVSIAVRHAADVAGGPPSAEADLAGFGLALGIAAASMALAGGAALVLVERPRRSDF